MSKSVLLVEDHPAGALVASTLLKMFGYECQIAATGEEALRHIKERHFSAALMDVHLPGGLSGLDTVRKLRNWETEQSKQRLPVIAMTASVWVEDKENCLNAGMDDFISKPFDADELKVKIERFAA